MTGRGTRRRCQSGETQKGKGKGNDDQSKGGNSGNKSDTKEKYDEEIGDGQAEYKKVIHKMSDFKLRREDWDAPAYLYAGWGDYLEECSASDPTAIIKAVVQCLDEEQSELAATMASGLQRRKMRHVWSKRDGIQADRLARRHHDRGEGAGGEGDIGGDRARPETPRRTRPTCEHGEALHDGRGLERSDEEPAELPAALGREQPHAQDCGILGTSGSRGVFLDLVRFHKLPCTMSADWLRADSEDGPNLRRRPAARPLSGHQGGANSA